MIKAKVTIQVYCEENGDILDWARTILEKAEVYRDRITIDVIRHFQEEET